MINLNPKYKALFKSQERYHIISGGRGSGKSYGVNTMLLLLTFESDHTILFTRYTMASAHISIIPEFLEKIEVMGMEDDFEITKTQITNKRSGSKIIFRGLRTSSGDQSASLKSLQGITTWVLEEAEELNDQSVFDKIDLSVRSNKHQNRIVLILNPATKEHWIYKKFFETRGIEGGTNGIFGDTAYIHTTYLDNLGNLPQSNIDALEAEKYTNPGKYNHIVLGGWLDKAEGVVFTNWSFGDFNPDGLQVTFGQDYGFSTDPSTLVGVAIDKRKRIIYVKEYLYQTGLTTSDLATINLEACNRSLIVGDSSEPRLIQELSNRGCNIRGAKKGPGSISGGISLIQDYKIVLDPSSKNVAMELNNYVYKDKGSGLVVDNYNHALDALRYIVSFHLMNSSKIEIV
jgi:phage terminase large subunit